MLEFSRPIGDVDDDSGEFDRNFSAAFDSSADKMMSWDRLRCCYTQVRVSLPTRAR